MPQLDIHGFSSQIFWLIINFIILYFIVSKYIVPKTKNLFDERERLIKKNLSSAENYNEEIQHLERKYKNMIDSANEKASKIILEAENNAKTHKEKKLSNLKISLNQNFLLEKEKIDKLLSKVIIEAFAKELTAQLSLKFFNQELNDDRFKIFLNKDQFLNVKHDVF